MSVAVHRRSSHVSTQSQVLVTTPLLPSRFFSLPSSSFLLSDVECLYCLHLVDQPVELPCKTLVCLECCLELLRKDESCPACSEHHESVKESFNQPTPVIQKIIDNLMLRCDNPHCNSPILLQHLGRHVESGCKACVKWQWNPSLSSKYSSNHWILHLLHSRVTS